MIIVKMPYVNWEAQIVEAGASVMSAPDERSRAERLGERMRPFLLSLREEFGPSVRITVELGSGDSG